jgi:hypothetical protein
MKKYILIVAVCFNCFSQKSVTMQSQRQRSFVNQVVQPIENIVNNQSEEVNYFSAYVLPLSQKANIQTALDTYGAIRLEKGDYRGVPITLSSNQKIYGHQSLTQVSEITIPGGTINTSLENLIANQCIFQSGGITSNITLKSIRYTNIKGINIQLSNSLFINCVQAAIQFDCSVSGYLRNNKIIRHQIQDNIVNLRMKGNLTTPSYGNVNLHTNFLTSGAVTTEIDTLEDAIFVGVDAEGWNLTGTGTEEMFVTKNIGKLKITNLSGDNAYSAVITPAYNIQANELFILNKTIGSNNTSKVAVNTNLILNNSTNSVPRSSGTVTGYTVNNHIGNLLINKDVLATDAKVITSILGTQYTPWIKPTWETLPDPLGINWATERVGKPDSRAYIQNLIDTNGIAQLPEGIFYISGTLNITLNGQEGIVGVGTGKTVICGLNDSFPLLTLDTGTDSNFTLGYLTLQGGSTGLYAGKVNDVGIGQIAYQNLKYIIFRDQVNAIHLNQITGIDSNFFERLAFINCGKAFYQQPRVPYVDLTTSSYIDKTVFYKCQFINCDTAVSMIAERASNLNMWLDCQFDGGQRAFDMQSSNNLILANCEVKNYTGDYIIKTNSVSIYSSKFHTNNTNISTINSAITDIEGCEFLDNDALFSGVDFNPIDAFIYNSKITGNVLANIPNGGIQGKASLVLGNNQLLANPSLSKILVNVFEGIPTVIIDQAPNPYPQFLVTQ